MIIHLISEMGKFGIYYMITVKLFGIPLYKCNLVISLL